MRFREWMEEDTVRLYRGVSLEDWEFEFQDVTMTREEMEIWKKLYNTNPAHRTPSEQKQYEELTKKRLAVGVRWFSDDCTIAQDYGEKTYYIDIPGELAQNYVSWLSSSSMGRGMPGNYKLPVKDVLKYKPQMFKDCKERK